ncbi:transcription repressor OFP13-like [Zingiber officinale]|uniref:Transcription repressor n=1 Tax=Zingiber officinale TaxID=94328 RepID=A0A8J5EZZ2_ZINOF|nr:transcription repressor OFP13-like [Zingiber officinale]KAG6475783.1 hypothetical protein ZIOFF_065012 [Zingiber officinale]
MGKKLGFGSFLLKLRHAPPPWPSCREPKTESFRDASVCKTVNSVHFESAESCFTHSSTSEARKSFSAASEEAVVPLRPADRIFFRRSGETSSILEEAKPVCTGDDYSDAPPPFEGGVALAVNSEDPYRDFRRSMEEMVAAHGLSDWRRLEALLVWYLSVNRKKTHGFIFGAFADLIVALASSPASSSSNSFQVAEIKEHESTDSNQMLV